MKNTFRLYSIGVLGFVFILSSPLALLSADNRPGPGGRNERIENHRTPFNRNHPRLPGAIEATRRHGERMMSIPGVVAASTGVRSDGEPVIRIFTESLGVLGIPEELDGVPVNVIVAGRFYALADPSPSERWPRPVPIGVSVGHPDITAGTIGARVTDGVNIFLLSNNHVLANTNTAFIGESVLQPGPIDGGTFSDSIGTLAAFEEIRFCTTRRRRVSCPNLNTIDAAIALTSSANLSISTPSNGYGNPHSTLHPAFGDPAVIGDENLSQLLGEPVQKYGRSTGLTSGTVDGINATVDVCYNASCSLLGRFMDQIIITPGNFSAGGDSGALIVSEENKHPVGLLFAGGGDITIANRIDRVFNRFGVVIEGGATTLTLSINDVSVPEGDVGTTTAVFTVRLSQPPTEQVTVDYRTENGSATFESVDYFETSGTLAFEPGEQLKTIPVTINGDSVFEANETFFLSLSNPSANVNIVDERGEALILNDDPAPPGSGTPPRRRWRR